MLTGCAVQEGRTFLLERGALSAEIAGFRNNKGEAIVSLFSVDGGFPKDMERAWQNQRLKIESGRAHALFTDVPYGEYALSVLHDENGDKQMKSSWLGQPREGFGFSGRPRYNFGPPTFSDAAFLLVSTNREIVIWMKYETERKKTQGKRRTAQDGKPGTE